MNDPRTLDFDESAPKGRDKGLREAALLLFPRIENDLNPRGFTAEDLSQECGDGDGNVEGYEASKILDSLVNIGKIEEIEPGIYAMPEADLDASRHDAYNEDDDNYE